MFQRTQGIPSLPDLTHPHELLQFGEQLLSLFLTLALLVGALGIIIAFIGWGLRDRESEQIQQFLREWLERYSGLLGGLQHSILILTVLIISFLLCSTLANRYHYWEQAKVEAIAERVSGSRLEQLAPNVRYLIQEPYSYYTEVNGELVKVEDTQTVNRQLTVNRSDVFITIDQVKNLQDERNNYLVNFTGVYEVINSLPEAKELFFEISPPYGYTLLQNLRVEQDGQQRQPETPGNYSFSVNLEPQETTIFRITYQAQGAPRLVYNAGGQLVSNFRLTMNANFPKADFASGIAPTEMKSEGKGTIFTWVFEENVSVQNPFGVFTATDAISNTGIIPFLLLLAPGIFLWWILLLYLSLSPNWRNVIIAAGVFFACILALTYFSRVMNAIAAWTLISGIFLTLVWGLGRNRRESLAAIICTISGAILPVLGLLVPYSGLTLSLAGLLSMVWITVQNWYGFGQRREIGVKG
ncbi:MAG: hypothetical protein ACOC0N_04255 [Chroococcales cyanobacterium]